MQAWELEKRMWKAQDKIEEIRKLVNAAPDPELIHIGDGKRRYGLFLIQLRQILEEQMK